MILFNDTEMANIIFLTIQKHKDGENKIVTDIISLVSKEILKKDVHETQDIYDTTIECFDFYNSFVKEKNMKLPIIENQSYDLVLNLINNIIGEI